MSNIFKQYVFPLEYSNFDINASVLIMPRFVLNFYRPDLLLTYELDENKIPLGNRDEDGDLSVLKKDRIVFNVNNDDFKHVQISVNTDVKFETSHSVLSSLSIDAMTESVFCFNEEEETEFSIAVTRGVKFVLSQPWLNREIIIYNKQHRIFAALNELKKNI